MKIPYNPCDCNPYVNGEAGSDRGRVWKSLNRRRSCFWYLLIMFAWLQVISWKYGYSAHNFSTNICIHAQIRYGPRFLDIYVLGWFYLTWLSERMWFEFDPEVFKFSSIICFGKSFLLCLVWHWPECTLVLIFKARALFFIIISWYRGMCGGRPGGQGQNCEHSLDSSFIRADFFHQRSRWKSKWLWR